jgi:hypothetical protein
MPCCFYWIFYGDLPLLVRPQFVYECPWIGTGLYSSSRYFSSSSVNVKPLAPKASSILSAVLKPIIGDVTLLLIQARATWEIFHSCFFASSSTRSMIFLSVSWEPVVAVLLSFSAEERVVEPKAEAGRAR